METEKSRLYDLIYRTVLASWFDWSDSEYGCEQTAVENIETIREHITNDFKNIVIDYDKLKLFLTKFYDTCFAKDSKELKHLLISQLDHSEAIRFGNSENSGDTKLIS